MYCLSPPLTSGADVSVPVDVSFTASVEDFTSSGALFSYDPDIQVSHAEPRYGPVSGGTEVKITSGPFTSTFSGQIKCRFGDSVVNGTWQAMDQVSCVAPKLGDIPEVQTVRIFSLAWAPEIQSIEANVDDFVSEVHTIYTRASKSPAGEIQYCDKS